MLFRAFSILILLTLATCEADKAPPASGPTASPEADKAPPRTTPQDTTPPPPPQVAPPQPKHRPVHEVHAHLNAEAVPVALRLFDEEGIARVVNLSGGHQNSQLDTHLAIARSTQGRVLPFFNIDWSRLEEEGTNFGHAIASDLRAAVEAGAAGLKISKALGLRVPTLDGTGLLPVDDPLLDPIFEAAGELGVPVSIHTGDPKAFFEPVTPDNERYKELAAHPSWSFYGDAFPSREALLAQRARRVARHPETPFILVHFGNNPEDIDFVDRLLDAHPNAYVDVSARLAEIGRHDPEKVRALFIKHRKRILFGTDFMLSIRGRRARLILGSSGDEAPGREDIHTFFDLHWRYFESDAPAIPNPVPIQGDWDIHPIHLPEDILDDLYIHNAERLIFHPWDTRNAPQPE